MACCTTCWSGEACPLAAGAACMFSSCLHCTLPQRTLLRLAQDQNTAASCLELLCRTNSPPHLPISHPPHLPPCSAPDHCLPEAEAKSIAAEVLLALQYLHLHGFIYRWAGSYYRAAGPAGGGKAGAHFAMLLSCCA